ncbi:MAG: hypothetical protein MJK12_11250 [Colwellia sp.]|nr:hypothetical protein [Colwellia sp.]
MNDNKNNSWQQEWQVLHNDHENYERFSLIIKLLAITVCCINLIFNLPLTISVLLLLTLWLQDAIWKTFQARLSVRLLLIEQNLDISPSENSNNGAFQLYTTWQAQRLKSKDLVLEYIANALRPTIMFPYAILILINLIFVLL